MPARPRLVVWAERNQEDIVRDAMREADLQLAAIGAASSTAAVELASALDVERVSDIRQAIQHPDADVLWIAAPDRVDADERRLIREIGIPTVTSEPRPGTLADVLRDPDEPTTAELVPLMRRSPGFRSAFDALSAFGPAACVDVCLASRPGEGTLFARLFDAMDVLLAICGRAEGVHAALAGPRTAVPESTAALRGHLTANVRFAERACACVTAGDNGGRWLRQITILGEGGCLRIDDGGYEWAAADGGTIERGGDDTPPTPGALVGMQITRVLRAMDTTTAPPPDTPAVLALCEAALLSGRTGQAETPQRVLEMHGKWS